MVVKLAEENKTEVFSGTLGRHEKGFLEYGEFEFRALSGGGGCFCKVTHAPDKAFARLRSITEKGAIQGRFLMISLKFRFLLIFWPNFSIEGLQQTTTM